MDASVTYKRALSQLLPSVFIWSSAPFQSLRSSFRSVPCFEARTKRPLWARLRDNARRLVTLHINVLERSRTRVEPFTKGADL